MKLIKKAELKGILTLLLIIAVLTVAMMATTGKLEQWFGITLFSGPRLLDKIVFTSEKNGVADIFVMNTDGSDKQKLTDKANPDSLPVLSPLGNKIAFVASRGGVSQIYAIGAKGGEMEQITNATGPKSTPAYSPDGKQFSFIASGKVYVSEPNGGNPSAILPGHEETQAALSGLSKRAPSYSTFAWGPDSAAIAAVAKDDNDSDVLVYMQNAEAKPVRIPFGTAVQRAHITTISWAAKTLVLAITAVLGKTEALIIFDPTASGQQQVRRVPLPDGLQLSNAVLSPDGTVLLVGAQMTGKAGSSIMLKMDMSNGQLTPIAKGNFENLMFSHKGDMILATVIHEGGARDIVSMDVSTGAINELTNDGSSYNAVWTPVSEK